MSDSIPTAPLRRLKSPFNGEVWTVPPEMSREMYEDMIRLGGFVPIEEPKGKPAKVKVG